MRAESIEQIREHLARGGKVTLCSIGSNEYGVIEVIGDRIKVGDSFASFWTPFNATVVDHWELLPIEEEKPSSNPEVRKFRCPHDSNGDGDCHLCFRDNECRFVIVKQRIRQSLLFGHYPSLDDLRDWWQATTGERIEWGRRCEKCGGEGVTSSQYMALTNPPQVVTMKCPACINHPGYTVRPTWMDNKATGAQEDGQ